MGCPVRRISLASRSALKRPAAFIRLKFLQLLVLIEAGIVIFPPGPTTAPSSRASNCSVLLTLITVLVVFPLVPLVVDRVGDLTVVLDVPLVVTVAGEDGPNGGALLSG